MNKIKIISDSSCDLSSELLVQYDIEIVLCYVSMDGITYLKEGVDIERNEFLNMLQNCKTLPKTSTPPIEDYLNIFKKSALEGKDIICICLNSNHSGLIQCANIAKEMLFNEYPNIRVTIIDSTQSTATLGMLLIEVSKMRAMGLNYDEILSEIELIKRDGIVIFSVSDFQYMFKSGRMKKVDSIAGSLLSVRPIICFQNAEHRLVSKVRGWNQARHSIVKIAETFLNGKKSDYNCVVVHSALEDEAAKLKNMIEIDLNVKLSLLNINIGCTIAAHIGPKALGLAIMRKYVNGPL